VSLLELEEVLIDRCIYWDERRRYCLASKREHERNLIGGYEICCAECTWLLDALRDARGLGPWPRIDRKPVWPKRRRRGKGKFKRLFLRSAKEVELAILENPENPS
jgi:hypothetical protein